MAASPRPAWPGQGKLLCALQVTLAMTCSAAGWAQSGDAHAAERARLQAERERIEAQFKVQEMACRERFAVTACIEDAKQRRRDALAGPRAQALALDDIERKERAATRRETVRERQRLLAQRPVPVEAMPAPASAPAGLALPQAAAAPGSSPTARARPFPTAASQAEADRQDAERTEAPASGPRSSKADSAASRRAAAAAQRQQRVVSTQARIASREAARLNSGKAAAPLPLPPRAAASASSAPR